jgi:hypothetical protein
VTERCGLLHNMSAPPKTVVKYAGLAELTRGASQGAGRGGLALGHAGTFGVPVLFELEHSFRSKTPRTVLQALGEPPTANPAARLEALLDARAAELPLPDGCVVIDPDEGHAALWRDPLTVLAVLSKCSHAVWLRAKQPSLTAALARRTVALLVPPAFAGHLPEPKP